MTDRYLTITLQPDWQSALRNVAEASKKDTYQGEVLNFESPAQFFGQLTERRWNIVRAMQGLGLLERTENGGVICPFSSMHIDMHLNAA